MRSFLQSITDRVSTRKGAWVTLSIWLAVMLLLTFFAPTAQEYQVSSIETIPDDAPSSIAQDKVDAYFDDSDGVPAMLVFQADDEQMEQAELVSFLETMKQENIDGLHNMVPLADIPPQATAQFFSKDKSTVLIPMTFDSSLENAAIKNSLDDIYSLAEEEEDMTLEITGPAAIGADTIELFSRADIVLMMSTVAIILVLLIVIYRSPFLSLIPLLAAGFVFVVVNQVLGLMGIAGFTLGQQSFSIMTILLFAAIIDYSLFVFSRYREELKEYENKYEAMKQAMRGTGIPLFYSGGTVLAAMLMLLFAVFVEYQNFAPVFGTAIVFVLIAVLTLVPALFALFGRRSFWPRVPHVGDKRVKQSSFWSKVGRFVTQKPVMSVASIGVFLLLSTTNVFNLEYEFNTMKSFPEDMPSREGYEQLEETFAPGELAPTTVLLEAGETVTEADRQAVMDELTEQSLVSDVRIQNMTDDQEVISYQMTFEMNPYSSETMDALEEMMLDADGILQSSNVQGELYFAGETAKSVDDRSLNNRDLIVIVILETVLIFGMLIFLTRSFKLPLYMMGTILVSFVAALGLGSFLSDLFFGIDTISNRVPLYAFVFLVALGIDYNIMLVSRFMEEREKYPVKEAVEKAVANTGGVISSAGIILAATFSVLMTQPIQLLFVFGFIVAVGILIDTFLVRGVLLPGLLVLFEKDKN
ncbi:putative drug exporter of the RND superfamily [Lentibacillus halodurans]|uniref:Putative drug exporter of the RND superfamily n=1 Tax=Lentibacillus halodurans TaxID=237679 RepID=A0A1I0YL81_9BACI|nr:MMPL family transporter [Lentibacillus halodurans]SFB13952.1 putative drug exporter of the RND superfamily [Lentibacillus halodurans]